jgi:hypothetical protein
MNALLKKAERLAYVARSFGWIASPRYWFNFLRANESVEIDRPIFLLGTQGGGLTLLSRMLRRDGTLVAGAGGPHYWTSADEIQNIYGCRLPLDFAGARWAYPDHPVLKGPLSWCYGADTLYPQYRRTETDVTPKLSQLLQRTIRVSLLQHRGRLRQPRFIDKSQCYILRVAFIAEILKDYKPKFVLVPRDPYVSVYRAAIGNARDMKALIGKLPLQERLEVCAEHYGNCMRDALDDSDRLGLNMPVVRFESLVEEPSDVLRTVCDFCEIEFDEDMIPKKHHRLPFGSRFRDRWYPVRSNVNQRYEDKLDRFTIKLVNKYCGDVVGRLGYRSRSDSDSTIDLPIEPVVS